jgi:hypothetical protein
LSGFRVERLDDAGVGHGVGLAHAEVEELGVRVGFLRRPLGALDLLKLVDGGVLAVALAADAFREQILNVAFLHR